MSTLLIAGADAILTMDDDRRELAGGDIPIGDGRITTIDLPRVIERQNVLARGPADTA